MWKLAICLGVVLVRKTVNGFFKPIPRDFGSKFMAPHGVEVSSQEFPWCRSLKPRILQRSKYKTTLQGTSVSAHERILLWNLSSYHKQL